MKHRFFSAVLFLVLTSFGCGGGGGASGNAPLISNLQYNPPGAIAGSGLVPVNGYIDFTDIDGNVSTLTITTYDAGGHQLSSNTNPVVGASGITSDTLTILVNVNAAVAGNYSFTIHVTDESGLNSNTLTGTFTVY
jgi:hypothetical protein